MFEGLVNNKALTADKLTRGLTNLFTVMRKGGLYGNDDIPWFNGGLFKKVNVPSCPSWRSPSCVTPPR